MDPKRHLKLYSLKSIMWGGFLGTPIVSAYLIRENYMALGQLERAKNVLIGGIIFTAIFFFVIFDLPREILDKIPKFLIPGVYATIIYFYAEKSLGKILKKHKEDGNPFHSGWSVFGISLIGLAALFSSFMIYAYFKVPLEYEIYDDQMAVFHSNENQAIDLHKNLFTDKDIDQVIYSIDDQIIPTWEKNLQILDSLRGMENFPEEFVQDNDLLKVYSQLRIDGMKAIKTTLIVNLDYYEEKVKNINQKIDSVLVELKAIR